MSSDRVENETLRRQDVENGVRYAASPITDNIYRVTDWEERGEGRIISKTKEPVDRDEVPEHWLEVLEDE